MRVGPGELLIILVVVLLIWGPGKIPELSRSLGQAIREFRSGVRDGEGKGSRE